MEMFCRDEWAKSPLSRCAGWINSYCKGLVAVVIATQNSKRCNNRFLTYEGQLIWLVSLISLMLMDE